MVLFLINHYSYASSSIYLSTLAPLPVPVSMIPTCFTYFSFPTIFSIFPYPVFGGPEGWLIQRTVAASLNLPCVGKKIVK